MLIWARRKGNLWLWRPRWLFRGHGLTNIPAVPFDISEVLAALPRLRLRQTEAMPAKERLDNRYTIDGVTRTAFDFLYGDDEHPSDLRSDLTALRDELGGDQGSPRAMGNSFQSALAEEGEPDYSLTRAGEDDRATTLPLDDPAQFSMTWTNASSVYQDAIAAGLDTIWAKTLTDPREAERQFWPMIGEHGLGYNLLVLQKVRASNRAEFDLFPGAWPARVKEAYEADSLYVIDMSIFKTLRPTQAMELDRFTPSTTTWLSQDAVTKELTPIAVRVSSGDGPSTFYGPNDPAWIYGLLAARTSITVWGIWLGHVYHWHIVSAALQMTMYNTFSEDHPLVQLLKPQSKSLIAFDAVLLLLWSRLAPPTSITSARQFLQLCDAFADGRDFFDDDPPVTLDRFGIREEDFSVSEPWDRLPIAGQLLRVWAITEEYVRTWVQASYADDQAVVRDKALNKWIKRSGSSWRGNVRGLPRMDSRAALIRVLTSLLHRITVHGNARLMTSIQPAQMFVPNYPPCLQRTDIPRPSDRISTEALMGFLPRTGTLGLMANFYFIFSFSHPYEPLISHRLFFGNDPNDPRNVGLEKFRAAIGQFIRDYQKPAAAQLDQWPLNIET